MRLIGYAVASADGLIADVDGVMPETLRFEADWLYFQDALNVADLLLLGRGTHETTPNPRRRRRLVLSSQPEALVQSDEVTFWANPAGIGLATALDRLVDQDGLVAVVGGTGVYDLVRRTVGYSAFHLSIAREVRLGAGRRLFGDAPDLATAIQHLEQHGLRLSRSTWLDRAAALELLVYERPDPTHPRPSMARPASTAQGGTR